MYIARRSLTIIRGLLKRYGPAHTKRVLWDKEFSEGHWDFIDDTAGDCVYSPLERYAEDGSILDLGCGPGNTANELALSAYETYVGVDISEVALVKARERTNVNGRDDKNRFDRGDLLSYVPSKSFDVILLRESLYHVPLGKVKGMLDRYSQFLTDRGVFIVRMATRGMDGKVKYRLKTTIGIIETAFDVLEQRQHGERGPTVIVFRPSREPSLPEGDQPIGVKS